MDRRATFFIIAAVAAFLLVPVADEAQRFVPIVVGVTYVVLAILSALDAWNRSRT